MLEAVAQTDVGRRRKLNEDNFLMDPETNLYAVCDGMGGHNAGEVASQMAIETLGSFIQKSHKEKEITWPYGLDVNLSFDGNRLKTALKLANKKVYKAADNREDYTGMGTTAVAALISEKVATIGSAGDSRVYLMRNGELKQLTRDDSWVSAAWAEGLVLRRDRAHLLRTITKASAPRIHRDRCRHKPSRRHRVPVLDGPRHDHDEQILKTSRPSPPAQEAAGS
jgi:protein phosphatase